MGTVVFRLKSRHVFAILSNKIFFKTRWSVLPVVLGREESAAEDKTIQQEVTRALGTTV
jgi:hypothetical protein